MAYGNVYFGPLKLGRLLERHMRIEDEFGRLGDAGDKMNDQGLRLLALLEGPATLRFTGLFQRTTLHP